MNNFFELRNFRSNGKARAVLMHPADVADLPVSANEFMASGLNVVQSYMIPRGKAVLIDKANGTSFGTGFKPIREELERVIDSSILGHRYYGMNTWQTDTQYVPEINWDIIFDINNYDSVTELSNSLLRYLDHPEKGLQARFAYQKGMYSILFKKVVGKWQKFIS